MAHIKENACGNDENPYDYFMDWSASIVQFPGCKTGRATTVVLQGVHGTGKAFLCNMMGKLFGRAYGYVNVNKYALEQFNGQLENKVLVFFDEVIWSHDRKKANYVKSLITERTLEINKKYINSYASNNYMRFILSTNYHYEGAFVEREDERRFFVLDVMPNHRWNKPYFDKIEADLNNGGFEELMYILVNRNISQRNFEKIPLTDAKTGTVLNNLDSLDGWICSKVTEGGFDFAKIDNGQSVFKAFGDDQVVRAGELFDLYCQESKGSRGCSSAIGFMMLVLSKIPSLAAGKLHDRRGNGYQLPSLKEAVDDILNTIGVDLSDQISA